MMAGLATAHGEKKAVVIDATYLNAYRTATRLGVKKGAWTPNGPETAGANTKLNVIWDSLVTPNRLSATTGLANN